MKKHYKKPNQIRAFFVMMKYFFLAQTRNPATFAFGFIFPIVFISIFGLIGNGTQKIAVGIPNNTDQQNPVIAIVKQQSFVTVTNDNQAELLEKLKQGKIGGIISAEGNSGHSVVKLTTSLATPQQTASLIPLVQGIIDRTNLQLAGVKNPSISLQQTSISGRQFRYIDFALPGQIGFSLLSTAVFGTVFGLIFLKKSLVLKRMFATPTHALTILLAQGGSRLILALLQTLLILVVGILIFKFYLPNGWITFAELVFLSAIGLVAFLGFGYFMAGLANDENSAGPLVNLITLPQFLLSGTFFATDNLPSWLQPIANNLPLSYFNQAIRTITTEGGHLSQTWPYMLGLLAWGAVMYILAARTFKWE
jgi:ABC-2 type transport system permease protein